MPLLKKNTLVKAQTDEFLRDDEEVFHCVMTGEIFKNYDEFAERTILCNSMVWTCSMTGKTNLTYEEALENEKSARQMLAEFPEELRVPTLYLANKSKYSSFTELADDLYLFTKDHFFIGENVEACFTGTKAKVYHVLQVIPPTESEIADAKKEPVNGESQSQSIPANLYKYDLEQVKEQEKSSERMIANASQIKMRKRTYYSKEKSSLFLKQYLDKDEQGFLKVKSTALKTFGVETTKFTDFFAGPEPVLESKKPATKVKKVRQETLTKFLSKNNIVMTSQADKQKLKEEEKERNKLERELRRQQNLEVSSKLKEWNIPQEDLLLEDQKVLPVPTPVVSLIPDRLLGDALAVLEFMHKFKSILKPNSNFSSMSLPSMERILFDTTADGPLNDFVMFLLNTHFHLDNLERKSYGKGVTSTAKIVLSQETKMSDRCQQYSCKSFGKRVAQLPLNTLTTSEILRLHLLASGDNVTDAGSKWRAQYRGAYGNDEDPAIDLRGNHPHILRSLAFYHVSQLSVNDKLKILNCLVDQLITFKEIRDKIDEDVKTIRNIRNEIRSSQADERKRRADSEAQMTTIKRGNVGVPADVSLRKLTSMRSAEEKLREAHDSRIVDLQKDMYKRTNLVGYDRAHRAYVKLRSVPAFMVNREDPNLAGTCLGTLTRHIPELVGGDRDQIIKHLSKASEDLNTSDKENEPNDGPTSSVDDDEVNAKVVPTQNELLMCSSDPSTCAVHSATQTSPRWCFVKRPEDLDALLESLNKRGFRESELFSAIDLDYNSIASHIHRTPKYLATGSEEEKPARVDVSESLRLRLIEDVLELEEKLFEGYLGGIKTDRDVFRKLVGDNEYEEIERILRPRTRMDEMMMDDCDVDMDGERGDFINPAQYLEDMKPDVAIESEDSEVDGSDEVILPVSKDEELNVQFLAQALLQVAISVRPNFLLRPMGIASEVKNTNTSRSIFHQWETSLLNATSYSQILLHYHLFNDSVYWKKSSVNMKCSSCRRGRDNANILLCDYCNDGYHIYCLKPKLTSIPRGEWFCRNCQDIQEKLNAKRAEEVKLAKESEVKECKVCGREEDDDSISCCNCYNMYHFECANLKRSVRGVWTCAECREEKPDEDDVADTYHYRRGGRSIDIPLNNVALQEVLRDVMRHPDAWPFVRPVAKHEVPDYYDIISKPMDFGTIKYKLNMGDYQYDDEVISDCRQVFENCITYNSSDDDVFKCGRRLLKFFRKKCKQVKMECHIDLEMNKAVNGVSDDTSSESSSTSSVDCPSPRKRLRTK